jgi:hypothetical protein
MVTWRVLGMRGLKYLSDRILREIPGSEKPPRFAYTLAGLVSGHVLEMAFDGKSSIPSEIQNGGVNWISRNLLTSDLHSGYFRYSLDPKGINLHTCRVVELGELLYNLQTVTGIAHIYRRLVTDPPAVEATIVELEAMRLLWWAKLRFRIVDRGDEEGTEHFDCEIVLPSGVTACCEAKCRLETTEFSESGIENTIETARKQLPKGHCGIIILKIPSDWPASEDILKKTIKVVERSLRSTTRIADVVIYARDLLLTETHSAYTIPLKEVQNPRSPHVMALNGGLIQDLDVLHRWLNFSILTPEVLKSLLEAEGIQ